LSRCAAVGSLDAIATTTAKAPLTWRNIQPSSFFALDSLLPDQPNFALAAETLELNQGYPIFLVSS
jgi:hypothetical protein